MISKLELAGELKAYFEELTPACRSFANSYIGLAGAMGTLGHSDQLSSMATLNSIHSSSMNLRANAFALVSNDDGALRMRAGACEKGLQTFAMLRVHPNVCVDLMPDDLKLSLDQETVELIRGVKCANLATIMQRYIDDEQHEDCPFSRPA